MVVADGIGGSVAGEQASNLAVQTIEEIFTQEPAMPVAERLEKAIQQANAQIYTVAQENPQWAGMGTTVVVAALVQNQLFVAHVGDSRAYLLRAGLLHLLTVDHTWAQEAIDAGVLAPSQAAKHPNRHVIKRYLGVPSRVQIEHKIIAVEQPSTSVFTRESPRPMTEQLTFQPGDTLLLCSDGLHDVVADPQIQTTLVQHPPQKAAEQLIDLANSAGGPDNITVVLVQWPSRIPVQNSFRSRWLPIVSVLVVGGIVLSIWFLLTSRQATTVAPTTISTVQTIATPLVNAVAATTATTPAPSALPETPIPTQQLLSTLVPTATATATPQPSPTTQPASTLPFAAAIAISATSTVTEVPSVPIATEALQLTPAITSSLTISDQLTSEISKPELLLPADHSAQSGTSVKFQWKWDGRLQANWGFEIRIWSAQNREHNGAHNAAESKRYVQISQGIYSLDLAAPDTEGIYEWSVAIVQLDPYARIGPESSPGRLTISQK
jgi:protein phosphatase